MYRQGDVLIIPIEEAKPGTAVPREAGRVVLAHGEATGHAHAIKSRDASLFELAGSNDNADRLLVLKRSVMLRHEEHAPIKLPAGRYLIRRQREYSPAGLRTVAD